MQTATEFDGQTRFSLVFSKMEDKQLAKSIFALSIRAEYRALKFLFPVLTDVEMLQSRTSGPRALLTTFSKARVKELTVIIQS